MLSCLQFSFFEHGDAGSLELVEEYLRIRNPISSRKEEIEKQKAATIKENEKIVKKMMAS